MSIATWYAIGTLAAWIGGIAAIRALLLALRLRYASSDLDSDATRRGLLVSLIVAAVGLALGGMRPPLKDGPSGDVVLPLVWVVMPGMAWLVLVALIAAGLRLVQAWLSLNQDETRARLTAAGIWLAADAGFGYLLSRDKDRNLEVVTGGVPMAWGTAAALSLFLAAAMLAMVMAGRYTRGRGYAKGVANQAALVAGSIIFGLPFAFLLVTSFKEDRDMSSPTGIVWIPKVQQTVPYLDPKNPYYEGRHNGQTVRGYAIGRENGNLKIDIVEPFAIRGVTFSAPEDGLEIVPRPAPLVTVDWDGQSVRGMVVENLEDGRKRVQAMLPAALKGQERVYPPAEVEPIREVGLRLQNYPEALSYLPPETNKGLVYVRNTLVIVILSVLGALLSSSIVAYAFSRMNFPGRNVLFAILLSTMMLPGAVTLLPQFLIFRYLGWIDTLLPLWVPAFFASAFNVFLLRQFFMGIPMELEDAAKIDGATYLRTFWSVMLPQIRPALAVIAIWTFMGAWNNFMGPLIYINSPENMPISYALQLFQGERGGEPGLLMAFSTLAILPVLAVFFFLQRYFIEGVTLSGLGGR